LPAWTGERPQGAQNEGEVEEGGINDKEGEGRGGVREEEEIGFEEKHSKGEGDCRGVETGREGEGEREGEGIKEEESSDSGREEGKAVVKGRKMTFDWKSFARIGEEDKEKAEFEKTGGGMGERRC
jgi:hypothetical protein